MVDLGISSEFIQGNHDTDSTGETSFACQAVLAHHDIH